MTDGTDPGPDTVASLVLGTDTGWTLRRFEVVARPLGDDRHSCVRHGPGWAELVHRERRVAFVVGHDFYVRVPPDTAAIVTGSGDAQPWRGPGADDGWVVFRYPTTTTLTRFAATALTHAATKPVSPRHRSASPLDASNKAATSPPGGANTDERYR